MKKRLLLFTLLTFSLTLWSQKNTQLKLADIPAKSLSRADLHGSHPQTRSLCRDTLRYGASKQSIVGNNNTFYFFEVWRADNEAISQTYLLSGESINIHGVEFAARNTPSDPSIPFTNNVSNATVRVAIYAVDGNNVPTTLIGFVDKSVVGFSGAYYYANFTAPLTVSSNYAVVLTPTTTNAVVDFYINDVVPNQAYDEDFCRLKSTFSGYPSAGQFISPPAYTAGWTGGPYNFDLIASPIVSYNITGTATASPTSVCLGQAVNFTGSATPAGILANRMFNFNQIVTHFNPAANDSTFIWDVNTATNQFVFSKNPSYTYTAAGTYSTNFYTLTGMGSTCLDVVTGPTITVKPVPTVTAGSGVSICSGASTTLTAGGATDYAWDNGAGTAATASVSPTNTTTYTVTGTTNGCSNTAQVVVTVNPTDNATFAYTSNTLCTSGANETPTSVTAGTFTATPAGLVFASTVTGEINVSGSQSGTYTITKTTAGICPDVKTQTITITGQVDAAFTYAQTSYCAGTANPSPVFAAGASAGIFTSTTGLVFVSTSTGEVNLTASTPGTYVVTNSIASSGSCTGDAQSFSVTINAGITAAVSGGGEVCQSSTATLPVNIDLTGTGPWDFTYSNGTTSTTVNAQTTSPYVINATQSGTYTVTNVSNANCSATGTGTASVIFNQNPVVTVSPVAALCTNGTAVNLTGNPVGGAFSGTGITGSSFNPSIGAGSYPVTYNYTDAHGCSGTASISVVVNTAPTVTLAALSNICVNYNPLTLTGGAPAGGVYSGTGITSGTFSPATAGIGTHVVTYTFQNASGCSATATKNIVVDACLGVENIDALNVGVYPNPADKVLTLTAEGAQKITFSVITADGKLVIAPQPISNGVNTIDVSSFARGIYFIHFESEVGASVQKIMLK